MIDGIEVGGSDTATPLNIKKRIKLMAEWIDLPKARLLDAGCGAGEYVDALGKTGANVQGIEYVEAKVHQWSAKHPGDKKVQRGDLEKLVFDDETFDAVLLNEVLEHVPNDRVALGEIYRVLKPGGTLILFSPNRVHPFETHGVYSLRTGAHRGMARTFMLPWIPNALSKRFVQYWARNYWPAELAILVRNAGFRVKHHTYVWQTFENNSGQQSETIRRLAPLLRSISQYAEKLPFIRRLGVSQLIIAERQ
jgi:2-polyprenyl-3-methyl-5-hydroxy-6-metoxy-1,4-benzoquinol methylase